MRQITITADQAADTARHIRKMVSEHYRDGVLDKFTRGLFKGQLIFIKCSVVAEEWILQGIENEINFYCRRAQQEERTPL